MAILKFRIYFEEDDSIYRDVVIKHTQTFLDLHEVILKAYEFDNKHQAIFTAATTIGYRDVRFR
ncbi:hypothetical protein [Niabella ginsengisoli]|uniref:Uncharacterized protein n=1 Tax=Niabella ginsengisoli TaxID=522298 RepID=A0ABS9SMS4_9BACT|nr:hypothetical protein [Niabella ginsengisoli]MCH5599591.1 hypothetical protein [Niabella ginsengisoli]